MRHQVVGIALECGLLLICGGHSSNLQIGNEQAYMSLKSEREAGRAVKVYETRPSDAEVLSLVC